mgnify:CR=1 FL=1
MKHENRNPVKRREYLIIPFQSTCLTEDLNNKAAVIIMDVIVDEFLYLYRNDLLHSDKSCDRDVHLSSSIQRALSNMNGLLEALLDLPALTRLPCFFFYSIVTKFFSCIYHLVSKTSMAYHDSFLSLI